MAGGSANKGKPDISRYGILLAGINGANRRSYERYPQGCVLQKRGCQSDRRGRNHDGAEGRYEGQTRGERRVPEPGELGRYAGSKREFTRRGPSAETGARKGNLCTRGRRFSPRPR